MKHIVVFSFNPPTWRWFERDLGRPGLVWHFVHRPPASIVERLMRPHLSSQIAGGFRAAVQARRLDAALTIVVDPRAVFWYSLAASVVRPKCRLIAYGFNFPELPRGLKRFLMARAFRRPDRFVVFSTVELELYSSYFGIPKEKIEMHLWAVAPPAVASESWMKPGSYICAVGGNGRDYQTLFEAAKRLPNAPFVVVVRRETLRGLQVPPNVSVRCNIENAEAMRILADSRFMVLPLRDAEVPCGHVTLVAAMHLGKATVITASSGVADYLDAGRHAFTCQAAAPDALADAIGALWSDPARASELGERAKRFAQRHCSEPTAIAHLESLLLREGVIRPAKSSRLVTTALPCPSVKGRLGSGVGGYTPAP